MRCKHFMIHAQNNRVVADFTNEHLFSYFHGGVGDWAKESIDARTELAYNIFKS